MTLSEPEDFRIYSGYQELAKLADTLLGVLGGVKRNEKLADEELQYLRDWIARYEYKSKRPNNGYQELFVFARDILKDGIVTNEELHDLQWLNEQFQGVSVYAKASKSEMRMLHGMLQGVMANGRISEDEAHQLKRWIQDHESLKGSWPYDEIETLLYHVLKDGAITDEENALLISMFTNFIKDDEHAVIQNPLLLIDTMITTVCATDPEITFDADRLYCFTGISTRGSRSDFASHVEQRGAVYHDSVRKDTDYLIIGADGNPCWAFSCYGRKIEKAITMRRKGSAIQIVHERDFWDSMVE